MGAIRIKSLIPSSHSTTLANKYFTRQQMPTSGQIGARSRKTNRAVSYQRRNLRESPMRRRHP